MGVNVSHQSGANVPDIANPVSGAAGGTLSAVMPCRKETGRKGTASEQEMLSEEINTGRRYVRRSKLRQQVKELKEEDNRLKDELEKTAQAAKEQEDESLFSDELKNEGDGQGASIEYDQDQHLNLTYTELRKKYDELKVAENDLKGEIKKHLEKNEKLSNELANIRHELSTKTLGMQELHKEMGTVKREKNEKLTSGQEALREEINYIQGVRSNPRRKVKTLKYEVKHQKDELEKKAQAAKEQEDKWTACQSIIQDWSTKYMDLKAKYDELKNETEEKKKLEDKLKDLEDQLKIMEQKSLQPSKELVLLQQRARNGDEKLQKCMKELEVKSKKLETQAKEMEELRKAKDDTLTRLSRPMKQMMSDGNPNITDLSDPNGPSKLEEIYSQLYDNEWTGAFEVLTENFDLDDKSAIELLLKILWESNKHASDVTQSTMKKIEGLLSGSSKGVSPDCKRLLREARKHVDIEKADDFLKDFEDRLACLERKYLREEKVIRYMNSCFQLSWLMSIQDPPVVLSSDPLRGDKFDTNLYKHYAHSGDKVNYIVWPALLLNKGGPILAKGVAEPYTILSVKSTPNVRPEENGISFGGRGQIEYYGKKQVSTVKGVAGLFTISTSYDNPAITKAEDLEDVAFDRRSQNKYDGNLRVYTSGSDRMSTTYYGKKASVSSESVSKMSPKHLPYESRERRVHSTTPTMTKINQQSILLQLLQQGVLKSSNDFDRFQRFSQDIKHHRESFLRVVYESDYDRYYRIFIHMYGHFNYT